MRLFLIIMALLFVVVGALFGALNGEHIVLDFYFARVDAAKGAIVLCALLAGWIVGGVVVYLGMVPMLRRRLRAMSRQLPQQPAAAARTQDKA